jgi:hypothetical protein
MTVGRLRAGVMTLSATPVSVRAHVEERAIGRWNTLKIMSWGMSRRS